jgi:hypothetical protein
MAAGEFNNIVRGFMVFDVCAEHIKKILQEYLIRGDGFDICYNT